MTGLGGGEAIAKMLQATKRLVDALVGRGAPRVREMHQEFPHEIRGGLERVTHKEEQIVSELDRSGPHEANEPGERPRTPEQGTEKDRLADRVETRYVSQTDPLFEPVLEALAKEYSERYGDTLLGLGYPGSTTPEVLAHLKRHPAKSLEPPHGRMLVLVDPNGTTVASGGFQRFDSETAELKRMWTSEKYRRQGLARKVIFELEAAAREHGYRRLYLTTGPKQPEAIALYRANGFSQITDSRGAEARDKGLIPFEKPLS
ncbi:GNAT family N-acetyltransferase [Nocardia sp. NPDC002869]|uniref:GNAT family N-acetyltransferase n=1 Tax=Nocardia sp. NPDC002869 TaxID=3161032 RepID=UPI00398C986E